MTPLLSYQVALGLHLLTSYLFGLVMGWLLWGAQLGLSGSLPGYQGQTRPLPASRPGRSQAASGRHIR